jgi:serine/threonine protein kinase
MTVTSACSRCQTPLDTGARFCQVCGLSVSGEQTAPLPTLLQVLRQGTLGEYEILREIGQGGMATVFLAHEIALDRKVAIKVMSPQFVHGADMIERFKREARTAAGLNHPHIIPIYAVRESQQLLFFVMKYIGGRSLDAILRDVGPLPFPMVRSILADIGSALDYAHRQGVVHRDVKPGNIMIDEEGFAVITDFGIARAAQSDSLTRSGTTVGTPSYLSPEACSGEVVGPAADQYSLGIVGYEMITGQLPFSADSSLGMMYAQVHSPPRPSDQLRPDCPTDLRDAIMRMLEKAPEDRFGSLKEAVQLLSGTRNSGRTSGDVKEGEDSGVRTHIGLLAVPRPGRPVGEMRTPNSPAPLSRVPPSSRTIARQRQVQLGRVLVGLLLAAIGGGATYLTFHARQEAMGQRDSLPTPVPPPDTRADSTLLVARGAAEYARERAVTSGATPAALAQGDSLRAAAESLAALGQKADAALLLTRATGIYGNAERPAQPRTEPARPSTQQRPAPQPGNQPAAGSAPGTTTTTPGSDSSQPVPDSVAVLRFYVELQRAISARQLGEVRRLVQNLTDSEEHELRTLFEDDDIATIQPVYTVESISRREEVVYAKVHEEMTVVDHKGKVSRKRDNILWTRLTLGPQGWRQIRSEKVKK